MEAKQWMKEFYLKEGDFEIQRLVLVNGKPIPQFGQWLKYSEASDLFKQKANLRSLTITEVILDLDEPERIEELVSKLKQDEFYFETWKTGSRGYHIKLLFPRLKEGTLKDAEILRKFMSKKYGCDPSKGSARTMVALEWSRHFKTGEIKIPAPELSNPGENEIGEELRYSILEWVCTKISTEVPTHFPAEQCVGENENYQGNPALQTLEKLKKNQRIHQLIQKERDAILDRSAADFLVAKYCVENGISEKQYILVLMSTKWSKIKSERHGVPYAKRTFQKAYAKERAFWGY